MSERQKILLAVVASVLLQIPFFAMILWGILSNNAGPKSLENLNVVEVAVATPTPMPVPIDMLRPLPPAQEPPVIHSDGLTEAKDAPVNPVFQSDVHSVAGSEQPGSGKMPLPNQAGKDRDELAFETKNYTPGTTSGGAAAPPVIEFAPAPDMPVTPPKPMSTPVPRQKPTPQATPSPESKVSPTPSSEMARSTPMPETADQPLYKPTPVPTVAPVAEATPDIARPTPVGTPKPFPSMAMINMKPRPAQQPQQATRPETPGYRAETQQNKIEGGISNRGPRGVDAVGTPVGRYQKKIADAIGSRWYYYVNDKMDLITTGSVRIRFYINQNGHVEDLKVISNESNESLANYSVQAITAAKIPPPPAELAPSLDNGRYEVTYTFTIYPN